MKFNLKPLNFPSEIRRYPDETIIFDTLCNCWFHIVECVKDEEYYIKYQKFGEKTHYIVKDKGYTAIFTWEEAKQWIEDYRYNLIEEYFE